MSRLGGRSCEQLTPGGMCGKPLDERGECEFWRDHVEEIPLDDDEADELAAEWFDEGGEVEAGRAWHGRPVEDGPTL